METIKFERTPEVDEAFEKIMSVLNTEEKLKRFNNYVWLGCTDFLPDRSYEGHKDLLYGQLCYMQAEQVDVIKLANRLVKSIHQ